MNTHVLRCLRTILALLPCLAGVLVFAGDLPNEAYMRLMREAAQTLLKEGNARYVSGHMLHPNLDAERRRSTVAEGQQPFATILACSDSRDPVEAIFDRGVGDLFVIRVAGNIAGTSELATVEYGVGHLNTPLLVVLGHSKCGAVTAVVKGAQLHGHLPKLAEKIKPAADLAAKESPSGEDPVPRAIEANVWQTIRTMLVESVEIREAAAAGRLLILGALYDLETGNVRFLGQHPDLKKILAEPTPRPTEGHHPDHTVAEPAHSAVQSGNHESVAGNKKPAPVPADQKSSASSKPKSAPAH